MKYLIMCEGPNELAIIRMLLEHDKLIFSYDDLLNLTPYHARQIKTSPAVKNALNLYHDELEILRIGDKLSDTLKIPKDYEEQIVRVSKYCTKPELEMLLILSEGLENDYEKVKSSMNPKTFSKKNIKYNRKKYNNSTLFFYEYFDNRIDLLVEVIEKYKHFKGKHKSDEGYLADLLK